MLQFLLYASMHVPCNSAEVDKLLLFPQKFHTFIYVASSKNHTIKTIAMLFSNVFDKFCIKLLLI